MQPFARPFLALVLSMTPACNDPSPQEPAPPGARQAPPTQTGVGNASVEGHHALPSPEEIAALPPDGGPEFNRLIFEDSPYLLQHARNPVDWYPWGEEAFRRAAEEDKPVFLSIGYSTCHWCHVMERESFEDEEVAELLNANFVCVKVDREERPDVDQLYMTITQRVTGSGGWPMTVVLTPDRKPFFCATYIPKRGRMGRRGLMELLPEITSYWKENREEIERLAERFTEVLQDRSRTAGGDEALDASLLEAARRDLGERFDPVHGGFGNAPKFPVPHQLAFLLQHYQRHDDAEALRMVETTLVAMRRGGIFDHVGFGFHRYSTDREWLVPHFEKMLYDQALLAQAYTAAFQVTGNPFYERVAREVLTYVQRDMTAPEGGFYSAEDADSEGEEGLFYLWTRQQLIDALGEPEAELFAKVYDVRAEGNFHDEATGQSSPRNILHLEKSIQDWARELSMDPTELEERLEEARQTLFEVREKRVHPLKDDKVLTDWNGLMISGFARAASAFDDPELLGVANRAADFALAQLTTPEGRLHKRWRRGRAGLPGTLEDYAFLAQGLLDLYEADFDPRWLEAARRLTDVMIEHFADPEGGGFFLSADDAEELLVRSKEVYDGAIPSGNSVAATNLLRLGRITAKVRYEELAEGILKAFPEVRRAPAGHTVLLRALDFAVGPSFEIVVAGDPSAEDTQALLRAFQGRYLPHAILLLRAPGEKPPIAAIAPYTLEQPPRDGHATAYVCRDWACKAPTSDPDTALAYLDPANW